MNRDGYVLEKCPPWCVEQSHFTDDIMNIKTHQNAAVAFVPASSSNGTHNTVSLAIGQTESLWEGVPEISPVFLLLVADDAN